MHPLFDTFIDWVNQVSTIDLTPEELEKLQARIKQCADLLIKHWKLAAYHHDKRLQYGNDRDYVEKKLLRRPEDGPPPVGPPRSVLTFLIR